MYSDKYISDFSENKYIQYLSDVKALREIADAYANQFSNPTYDKILAFKESLDHYVLKQIKTNPSFLQTGRFNNYLNYINYIFSKRVSAANSQLEYNTNVIFNDADARDKVLSFYSEDVRNKLLSIIKQNEVKAEYVFKRLEDKEKLRQVELDFIGEYLYSKRGLDSKKYESYYTYLLNEVKDNPMISNTPQIMAGFISNLPREFGDGCEECRVFLTNGYASSNDILSPSKLDQIIQDESNKPNNQKTIINQRLYSCEDKYISIAKSQLDFSLTSDKSLDYSRTLQEKDLYWISMVCFHELTHQYQNRHMKDTKYNSSGLSMLIRNLVNSSDDYSKNHDSYELEIEADENSWEKMYHLVAKYKFSKGKDKKEAEEQMKKCIKNKNAVFSRRTFLTKKDDVDNKNYFEQDMLSIKNNFVKYPKYKEYFKNMCEQYPMLDRLFTKDGQIKTTVLLDENISSSTLASTDANIMGCEMANYILNCGYETLKKHVSNDDLTSEQLVNLMANIYNSYHLDKLFVRSLSKVNLEQYRETQHNYNFANIREKYLEKFKNVANLVYKERELANIISKRYPNRGIELYNDPKYAIWNYEEMFVFLKDASNGVVNSEDVSDVIAMFEASGDKVLVELAKKTLNSVSNNQGNTQVNYGL